MAMYKEHLAKWLVGAPFWTLTTDLLPEWRVLVQQGCKKRAWCGPFSAIEMATSNDPCY